MLSKLGRFLRIEGSRCKGCKWCHPLPEGSSKGSVEANISNSSAEMLTKQGVLMVGGLELAPRPGCLRHCQVALDFHKLNVLLTGCELTRDPYPEQRLVGWCCC